MDFQQQQSQEQKQTVFDVRLTDGFMRFAAGMTFSLCFSPAAFLSSVFFYDGWLIRKFKVNDSAPSSLFLACQPFSYQHFCFWSSVQVKRETCWLKEFLHLIHLQASFA